MTFQSWNTVENAVHSRVSEILWTLCKMFLSDGATICRHAQVKLFVILINQYALVLITSLRYHLFNGENKNEKYWKISHKVLNWPNINQRKNFGCKNTQQRAIWPTVSSYRFEGGGSRNTRWLRFLYLFIMLLTGHFGLPSSNHGLHRRFTYNEAVVLCACAKHILTTLVYPYLAFLLKIEPHGPYPRPNVWVTDAILPQYSTNITKTVVFNDRNSSWILSPRPYFRVGEQDWH